MRSLLCWLRLGTIAEVVQCFRQIRALSGFDVRIVLCGKWYTSTHHTAPPPHAHTHTLALLFRLISWLASTISKGATGCCWRIDYSAFLAIVLGIHYSSSSAHHVAFWNGFQRIGIPSRVKLWRWLGLWHLFVFTCTPLWYHRPVAVKRYCGTRA